MQETQETWVQSLCQENPRKKVMETESSILAQKIPGTEEPGRLQSMESQTVGHNWATKHTHTHTRFVYVIQNHTPLPLSLFRILFMELSSWK